MGRRGRKVALVALAKKLLHVIWHLLVTGEEYVDRDYVKRKVHGSRAEAIRLVLEDAIPLLREAGYFVSSPGG
jgi:hypothetical protein